VVIEVEIETKNVKNEEENVHVHVHVRVHVHPLHLEERPNDVTQNIVKVFFFATALLLLKNIDAHDVDVMLALLVIVFWCPQLFCISFHFPTQTLLCVWFTKGLILPFKENWCCFSANKRTANICVK
jgi:hypothetical protein